MTDGTIKIPGLGETKKTYVYVGAAAAAGVLGYAWWAHSQGSTATDTPADGTTYGEDYAGLSGGGTSGTTTAGLGAGDSGGGVVTDPDLLPPTTNIEWSQRVTKILTERFGYDGQMVGAAIGKYLARIGLNQAEQDLIRTAWGQLGRPPVGDFPIIAAAVTQPPPVQDPPGTTPGGQTQPPPPVPAKTPAYDLSVAAGSRVTAFTDAIRSRSGKDVDWALLESANGGLAGNVNWGPSGSKDFAARTFKQAATYHIPSVAK